MFGGLYLEAALDRWALTGVEEDRGKARRIAEGLLLLAEVGERKGFVARGLCEDGRTHYAVGSNDQTGPWLYGLWRYVQSDVPNAEQRSRATARIVDVVEALHAEDWRVPCDRAPFDHRGHLARWHFEGAPRLLFVLRMMAALTGDQVWEDRYAAAIKKRNPEGGGGRVEICARGMVFETPEPHSWTASCSVAALRALWELEPDAKLKAAYAEGLRNSADLAAQSLPLAMEFDPEDPRPFSHDWRVMDAAWRPQGTVDEAVEVALAGLELLYQASPRHSYEMTYVREPLFAAWIMTLSPDEEQVRAAAPQILAAVRHCDYRRLHISQFFAAELAYYRLRRSSPHHSS